MSTRRGGLQLFRRIPSEAKRDNFATDAGVVLDNVFVAERVDVFDKTNFEYFTDAKGLACASDCFESASNVQWTR